MSDEIKPIDDQINAETPEAEVLAAGEREATQSVSQNDFFRQMVDRNFLEYAGYVIKDRAIPDVDDGLKPVQRRILWSMHKLDDGRFSKVAYIVGDVMGKYHPHGDASIYEALVVLSNKGGYVSTDGESDNQGYFFERQGNFGDVVLGTSAAAGRYIECRLNALGKEVLYNDDLTPMVETYDSRNLEPIHLPVKIPALLLLGSDGIAVGMSTKILPHNFNEVLQAEIACLRGEDFELYPDFLQGGRVDVSEYNDGVGKVTARAKIDIDGRELVIREIPATTTTESLIASIKRAKDKNKIKVTSVIDHTSKDVCIRITPMRGIDPQKMRQALYMYTDCAVSISSNLTVICDRKPRMMTIHEVIERNAKKMLQYTQKELEIALERQNELFQAKTLAQIFFENRIYKRIEECKTEAAEYREVGEGLAPFRHLLRRDVTKEDIDKLLALPVRRISRFDIDKNQKELREIDRKIAEIKKHLAHLVDYAIEYLENLLAKYGPHFPRRSEIEHFSKIDRSAAALNNIKIGWDRKNGYIGTAIKSDEMITCNEYDKLLKVRKNGTYQVTELPKNKEFVDRLYECRKYDAKQQFGVIYRDKKTKKYYAKRTVIAKYITDREYLLCPENCQLELFTPRADAIWLYTVDAKRGEQTLELNLMTLPLRNPKARGILLTANEIKKLTHSRFLTPEETAGFAAADAAIANNDDSEQEAAAISAAAAVQNDAVSTDHETMTDPAPVTPATVVAKPDAAMTPELADETKAALSASSASAVDEPPAIENAKTDRTALPDSTATVVEPTEAIAPAPRKRGRKPKTQPVATVPETPILPADEPLAATPAKTNLPEIEPITIDKPINAALVADLEPIEPPTPRRRGRPRKAPNIPSEPAADTPTSTEPDAADEDDGHQQLELF